MSWADDVAIAAFLAAAVYEALAHYTRKVPYITVVINKAPWWVRAGGLTGGVLWALDHFRIWDFA